MRDMSVLIHVPIFVTKFQQKLSSKELRSSIARNNFQLGRNLRHIAVGLTA